MGGFLGTAPKQPCNLVPRVGHEIQETEQGQRALQVVAVNFNTCLIKTPNSESNFKTHCSTHQ